MDGKTNISVDVSPETYQGLREISLHLDKSITALVEKALDQFLNPSPDLVQRYEDNEVLLLRALKALQLWEENKPGPIQSWWVIDAFEVTDDEVARILGVPSQAVKQWSCPRNSNGTYRLPDVVQWWCARLSPSPRG